MFVWPDITFFPDPCKKCRGTGLVCELHSSSVGGHDECDAPTVPCPACRPKPRPRRRALRASLTPSHVPCSVCDEMSPFHATRWFTTPAMKGSFSYPSTFDDPTGRAYCPRCAAIKQSDPGTFKSW